MSIKDFIENTRAEGPTIYGKTLPIPYIESVEVNDRQITVTTAVYINVASQDYQLDSGAAFLGTFSDIHVYIMALFDRNSNTDNCAIAPSSGVSRYASMSPSAWTSVVKNGVSPLKYWKGSEYSEVVTQFIFEPLSDSAADQLITHVIDEDNDIFSEYSMDNGDKADPVSITARAIQLCTDAGHMHPGSRENYQQYLRIIVADIIQQIISNNDYDLVNEIYGTTLYTGPGRTAVPGIISDPPLLKTDTKTLFMGISLSEWTGNITDVVEATDGSAIIKGSYTHLITPGGMTPEIYDRTTKLGIKNMGFVAFSAPWHALDRDPGSTPNLYDEILAAAKSETGTLKYWENSISGINYVLVVKDDNLTHAPSVVYTDSNGTIYKEALRAIDGTYYSLDNIEPETILSNMASIADLTAVSDTTNTSFQYLLAQGMENKIDLLPKINSYRRAFPDKSTVTPEGRFYNSFTDILYSANKTLKRGIPLKKSLINNPIVKDWRSYSYGSSGTSSPPTPQDRKDIFSFDNALWSRYTEVTGMDPEEDLSTTTVEESGRRTDTSTTTIDGGQWNYNFIDHGFLFFNYERALKTTSIASKYLNTTVFEKYFGQNIFGNLFKMKKCYIAAYYVDTLDADYREGTTTSTHIGTMHTDIDPGQTIQETKFINTEKTREYSSVPTIQTEANYDKFDIVVTNDISSATTENGYITGDNLDTKISNEYGGADAMVKSKEYSFIALRGFSPITTHAGDDPLRVDTTFYEEKPINYRVACFEVQKCDAYNAFAARLDLDFKDNILHAIETNNTGISFKAGILVEDSTHDAILSLLNKIEKTVSRFDEYIAAASDLCSFNESTGFFNQYFIDAVQGNWPNPSQAPYYVSVVEALIFEDILIGSHSGDTVSLIGEVKSIIQNISPETGTINGITAFKGRLDGIHAAIADIVRIHGLAPITAGHIYGATPHVGDGTTGEKFSEIETSFDTEVASTWNSNTRDAWYPDAGYDNYPIFPQRSTSDETVVTTITLPDPGSPSTRDVTAELNTIMQGLLDDYKLSLDVEEVMIDIFVAAMAELEDRLGPLTDGGSRSFENLDIIDIVTNGIIATFPPMDEGLWDSFTDLWGNTGYAAAYNIATITSNFGSVVGVFNDMMDQLNSMDSSTLAAISAPALNLFGGDRSFLNSATDYMDSGAVGISMISSYASWSSYVTTSTTPY
jgi:hypothetical protein